jgi:hypothetical protein
MKSLPLQWVAVAEDESDAAIVTGLADRFAQEPEHGLEEWLRDNLDTYRVWQGDEPDTTYLKWSSVKKRASSLRIRIHGYENRALGFENAEVRKVFTLVTRAGRERPAGLLLHRDTDGSEDRQEGYRTSVAAYQQAMSGEANRVHLCLALPHPEIEAWLLAGFEPETDAGREALAEERRALGFDPREQASRLNPKRTSTPEGEDVKKSTKRILEKLLSQDGASSERCWREAPLERLRDRGAATGLVKFFNALETEYFTSLRGAGA